MPLPFSEDRGSLVTTTKEALHRMIDDLPQDKITAAERLLEGLRSDHVDPLVLALLSAPEDDEPITAEEEASAGEAWQEYLRGAARPWEDVRIVTDGHASTPSARHLCLG
jgi:hypothetical protein